MLIWSVSLLYKKEMKLIYIMCACVCVGGDEGERKRNTNLFLMRHPLVHLLKSSCLWDLSNAKLGIYKLSQL